MTCLRLIAPTVELKDEYLDMIDEWKRSGEEFVPWVLGFDTSDFPAMIKNFEGYKIGIGVPEGFVEHSS